MLGGLVPELLCTRSDLRHAGTTDVDVQVDLEIAAGTVNVTRLEHALRNAEFVPDNRTVWRWVDAGATAGAACTVVTFELLADLASEPAESIIKFSDCQKLGAANLRGTGFAARDVVAHTLTARVSGVTHTIKVNVTGPAGFLLAKTAAANARRKPKRTGMTWRSCSCMATLAGRSGPRPRFAHGSARTWSVRYGPP